MKNNIDQWYQQWCKETGRGGGVLITSSIREMLEAYAASPPSSGAGVWVRARECDMNDIANNHWRDDNKKPISPSIALSLYRRGETVYYLDESASPQPNSSVEEAAKEYARKRLVHTMEFVDYNKDMFFAFLAGSAHSSASVEGLVEEKDLIIQGLEEGSEAWKAEYDNCRSILKELVDLKVMKDTFGSSIEGYEDRKPLAWEAAKKFLEKYQHGYI